MTYLRVICIILSFFMMKSVAYSEDLPWRDIGHAKNVVAMASANNLLFAATSDNELWVRSKVTCEVVWNKIGQADNVTAMTAINGKLFAATSDDKLWIREPDTRLPSATGVQVPWEMIGHANGVVAMAAINGKIFATTNSNRLVVREPNHTDTNWQDIGHANNIKGMAAAEGKLFASDGSNLWVREPVLTEVNWRRIGHAIGVVGMTALADNNLDSRGPLYVADNGNNLWVREANTFTNEYCSRCRQSGESLCRQNRGFASYGFDGGNCYRVCGDGAIYDNRAITGAENGRCEAFPSESDLEFCERF